MSGASGKEVELGKDWRRLQVPNRGAPMSPFQKAVHKAGDAMAPCGCDQEVKCRMEGYKKEGGRLNGEARGTESCFSVEET